MRARDTDWPAASTARTLTSTVFPRLLYLIHPILSRAGVTLTLAVAESVPLSEAIAAVTVPVPRVRPALSVVAAPVLGAIVPSVAGFTDHTADAETAFP
jgi:hypothetical protein